MLREVVDCVLNLNGTRSMMGKDIKTWAEDNKDNNPDAKVIHDKYVNSLQPISDIVAYFVVKKTDDIIKVYRDLEKSPRSENKKNNIEGDR